MAKPLIPFLLPGTKLNNLVLLLFDNCFAPDPVSCSVAEGISRNIYGVESEEVEEGGEGGSEHEVITSVKGIGKKMEFNPQIGHVAGGISG